MFKHLASNPYNNHRAGNLHTCKSHQELFHVLSSSARLVLGSFHPEVCAAAKQFADYFNTTLRPWNCPAAVREEGTIQASPSIAEIVSGFAKLVFDMKWSSVALISTASGWWPSLSHSLELKLRDLGIVPKHSLLFDKNTPLRYIEQKLQDFKDRPCRALVFCMPADELGLNIFHVTRRLQLAQHNTLSIFLDVLSLPAWTDRLVASINSSDIPDNLTDLMAQDILLFLDNATLNLNTEEKVLKTVRETFDSEQSRTWCFALVDVLPDGTLRPLMKVFQSNESAWETETSPQDFAQWWITHKQLEECDAFCKLSSSNLLRAWVYWVISCAVFLVFCTLGVVAAVRYHLLKKKTAKAPYKVRLAAADFTFPQLTESLRVDEGMEAILCCWLQQLQEFGGPEVDKPDLLQNSGGASARTPLRTGSSPNLAKQVIVDPRVRYNGDLVQMKPVPSNGNAELKAKATELLVHLHGLRHENLNPLIGVLAEPPRAALVSEYCSRGSLQDVLQQDDIKLDWSFRLSLLTDLVRGMRYLHSTPIRVHGFLTSRNCVIDARWVLKVTDYGLSEFFEAQGVPQPVKSARGMLMGIVAVVGRFNRALATGGFWQVLDLVDIKIIQRRTG
ncbi:hypothetical protein HUJ05_005648 [Dendroctonus ponderosae]|nr:hypothetical protein HUJ05_005648 [Dendroctonus ponderosae]